MNSWTKAQLAQIAHRVFDDQRIGRVVGDDRLAWAGGVIAAVDSERRRPKPRAVNRARRRTPS